MKFFGKSIGTKAAPQMEDSSAADFMMQIGASASYISGKGNDTSRMKAFSCVPEVNAIFNLRARAAGNIEIAVVDADGKEVKYDSPVIDTLNNPNYFQSKQEWFGQTSLFRDIFGNEYINLSVPVGTQRPIGIFSLPSQSVDIKSTVADQGTGPFYLRKTLPDSIVYTFRDTDGRTYKLKNENLLHLNDNNVKFSSNTEFLKGTSKLDALTPAWENIIAAYEARNVLIVNRGAIGILSNASKDGIGGTAPMNKGEKERLQKQFQKYGLTKQQWQVIITNLALHWQQMAIDVDKLKLFEETREDTLKICDAYGTPYEMLSSIRNTTFDNKKEAQRQWYRDTIIPEAAARLAGISRKYNFGDGKYFLVPKFDHLPIFEEERRQRADSLLKLTTALTKALEVDAIDLNQYKEELRKFGIN